MKTEEEEKLGAEIAQTEQSKSVSKKVGDFAAKQKNSVKSFFSDFKKFISKGSVINLAIGLVIGTAFTAIVNSLVANIIMPLLGSLLPTTALESLTWKLTETVSVNWGLFIISVVNFFIIAFCIFFVLRLIMNTEKGLDKIKKRKLKLAKKNLKKGIVTDENIEALEEQEAADLAPPPETELDILRDIRKLLMANAGQITAEKVDDALKSVENSK